MTALKCCDGTIPIRGWAAGPMPIPRDKWRLSSPMPCKGAKIECGWQRHRTHRAISILAPLRFLFPPRKRPTDVPLLLVLSRAPSLPDLDPFTHQSVQAISICHSHSILHIRCVLHPLSSSYWPTSKRALQRLSTLIWTTACGLQSRAGQRARTLQVAPKQSWSLAIGVMRHEASSKS